MFEAPHDTFTPSSERIIAIVSIIAVVARGSAPIGMQRGSITTSSRGIPAASAASTTLRAAARRSPGSIEMPASSFAIPITAAP